MGELERLGRVVGAWVLIGVTVVTLLAELFGLGGTWRLMLTTAFVVLAPGWAVVGYVRSAPPSVHWSAGVAVSIGIGLIVGQGMLLLHLWHPEVAVAVLGLLTLPLLVHHLLRTRPPANRDRPTANRTRQAANSTRPAEGNTRAAESGVTA